jgi:hypothetical protein
MTADPLISVWVVYNKPIDYPSSFVVRRIIVDSSGELLAEKECVLAEDLASARKCIPSGLAHLLPLPDDDPVIAEYWL